jgi:hydroxyacylglutathione hydrolase
MSQAIRTIRLELPYHLGGVNCYLVATDTGHVLIDTGSSNRRAALERELERAVCRPGNLTLIVLTHGDFDHTGNAAYLRNKFAAPLAIHAADAGMLESGDMFWNRKTENGVVRRLSPILFGFGKKERCKPDIFLEEDTDLAKYGLDARVFSLPGHSLGSIGILTGGGDLICGDLLINTKRPELNSIIDDLATAKASVDKLKGLKIKTVYPGHGEPFAIDSFWALEKP